MLQLTRRSLINITNKHYIPQATTDLNAGCTEQHGGTSAAAPLAAGVIALALSAKLVNANNQFTN